MGIVLADQRGQWWVPCTDRCFLCGDPLADGVFVYWAGDGNQAIMLHPRCAERLGAHLIADSREADMAGGHRHWGVRSERAFLASIRKREVRHS